MRPSLLSIFVAILAALRADHAGAFQAEDVKPQAPNLSSEKVRDDSRSTLTFPTNRELSRSIVRRNSSPVELGFPKLETSTPSSSTEVLDRLNASLAAKARPAAPAPARPPTSSVVTPIPVWSIALALFVAALAAAALRSIRLRSRNAGKPRDEWLHVA